MAERREARKQHFENIRRELSRFEGESDNAIQEAVDKFVERTDRSKKADEEVVRLFDRRIEGVKQETPGGPRPAMSI